MSKQDNEKQESEEAKDKKPEKAVDRRKAAKLGKFLIFPDSPAPEYDAGPVKAYYSGQKPGETDFFALICEPHLTPRARDSEVYLNIINPALSDLIYKGVAYWPPADQERYVFIYRNNLGERLLKSADQQALGLKPETVIDHILKPLVGVLIDFRDKDFVHGNIRATNFFDCMDKSLKYIAFGECLATPAGYLQPALYETISRAMSPAIGRGKGTHADDLYALGVALVVLMRSSDSLAGFSDEDIIRNKIELGSYAAITGRDKFTGAILELLRGLLQDDPSQRWTIDEVDAWLSGLRLTPKQNIKEKKALRPFIIRDQRYFYSKVLAHEMDKYPADIVKEVKDGSFEQWVDRSLDNPKLLERVERVIIEAAAKGKGDGYNKRLLSFLSMALDGNAPLRYGGLKIFGDALGSALLFQVMKGKNINIFNQIFSGGIVFKWLELHNERNIDFRQLLTNFDKCKRALGQPGTGYGLERCLYILNSDAHCLSEKLSKYHVISSERLLFALEDKAKNKKLDVLPVDRHVAAFLLEKDSKVIDRNLLELNSSSYHKNVLGNLRTLAEVQGKYGIKSLPALARSMESFMPSIYKRFHDKKIQDSLRSNIERHMKAGDLVRMSQAVDNQEIQKKDYTQFVTAMKEYRDLDVEYNNLDQKLADQEMFGRSAGSQITSLLICMASACIILIMTFVFLSEQSAF